MLVKITKKSFFHQTFIKFQKFISKSNNTNIQEIQA